MATAKQITMLENKVASLLSQADQIKRLIEAHEFDAARIEADGLAVRCASTNTFANELADAEETP